MTPGTTAFSGKCPLKKGSLAVNILYPVALVNFSILNNLSKNKNDNHVVLIL